MSTLINITIIPSFISKHECEQIIQKYDVKSYDGNDVVYFDTGDHDYNIKKLSIKDELADRLCSMLGYHRSTLKACSIVYYPENSYNPLHADNSDVRGDTVTKIKDWTHTVIVFLNEEFDGGELIYPDQGLILKPKSGLAVMTPADHNYMHLVNTITSGERYTLVLRFVLQ